MVRPQHCSTITPLAATTVLTPARITTLAVDVIPAQSAVKIFSRNLSKLDSSSSMSHLYSKRNNSPIIHLGFTPLPLGLLVPHHQMGFSAQLQFGVLIVTLVSLGYINALTHVLVHPLLHCLLEPILLSIQLGNRIQELPIT